MKAHIRAKLQVVQRDEKKDRPRWPCGYTVPVIRLKDMGAVAVSEAYVNAVLDVYERAKNKQRFRRYGKGKLGPQ